MALPTIMHAVNEIDDKAILDDTLSAKSAAFGRKSQPI